MRTRSLLKISIAILLMVFSFFNCYTKVKYEPPDTNNKYEIQQRNKFNNAIFSNIGIFVDSTDHIIYSNYSYSEFGISSRTYVIDFKGRRKFYYNKYGEQKSFNDFYLKPEILEKIEYLFSEFGFDQFPMTYPKSRTIQTIGGGAIVAYRKNVGDDLIISILDKNDKDDYVMNKINSMFLEIDKQIFIENNE